MEKTKTIDKFEKTKAIYELIEKSITIDLENNNN